MEMGGFSYSRAETTNQSSMFDLNASLNSSVYRKRRRKSLFRVNIQRISSSITRTFSSTNLFQSTLSLLVISSEIIYTGEGYPSFSPGDKGHSSSILNIFIDSIGDFFLI